MTVCRVAIVSGCKKCPVVRICPLKTVLGNYRPEGDQKAASKATAVKATKGARSRRK